MGTWTYLNRWDSAIGEHVVLDATGLDTLWRHKGGPLHIEELHTHRAWHALHVALTGEAEGGTPPWCHVVWTTPAALDATHSHAAFHHDPETTREVAEYLQTIDFQTACDTLYTARELGVVVYSFDNWGPQNLDIVQSGLFRRVFDGVVRFYAAAAAADHIVTVYRG